MSACKATARPASAAGGTAGFLGAEILGDRTFIDRTSLTKSATPSPR